jgi:8-oxo-dGTP diphosphatase
VIEPSGAAGLRIRQAVRALLLTPASEVLLVRFEFPTHQVWAMPGGGLDPGEDHLTALHRELAEETGLVGADVGPHIWTREHVIPFLDGRYDGQRDQIHLVHTDRFDAVPAIGWDQMRAERVHEMRWWDADEISSHAERIATGDASAVGFAPGSFAVMLRQLIDGGLPAEPLITGV